MAQLSGTHAPQAKGSNLLGLQWAVRSRFGPGVEQRVLDELPPALRAALAEALGLWR